MTNLRVGFIPLIDSASILVAADRGFAKEEGLTLELVREVSWSNVRDKLNLGLFDAAHLLAPVPLASTLGLGHVRMPITVPFTLNMNGNAITISPALWAEMKAKLEGDERDPMATARALARVVAARKKAGAEPPIFGMTFPYSTHNYQLRFWMAAGGVDPDEDVRLVVLPPPYMVDSLASGQVEGFCVGAPWNSVAVDRGIGRIVHFVSDIQPRAAEKVVGLRADWADKNPSLVTALVRALRRAAAFIETPGHYDEVAAILARTDRIGVDAEVILRTLQGRLKIDQDGTPRESDRYIMFARDGAARPDPLQASWLYAQMVRWKQTAFSAEALALARGVFRADLYDAAFPDDAKLPSQKITAFAGPDFDANDVKSHLEFWELLGNRR
jgi:two-component system, oxyanion-binding sensor